MAKRPLTYQDSSDKKMKTDAFRYYINYSPISLNTKFDIARVHMQVQLKMDFAPNVDLFKYQSDINRLYTEIIGKVIEANPYNGNAKYWVDVSNSEISKFYMGRRAISEFDDTEFSKMLFKITQSKRSFINHEFILDISVHDTGSGGKGWRRRPDSSQAPRAYSTESLNCVVKIQNNDNSCGFRAIALGIYYYKNLFPTIEQIDLRQHNQWQKLIGNGNSSDKHQRSAAEELIKNFNVWRHRQHHSTFINKCSEEKCCQCDNDIYCYEHSRHCGYENVLDYNKCFGSSDEHFDDMNNYLNTIGLSLVIYNRRQRKEGPFYIGDRKNKADLTIHLDRTEENGGHFNFIRSPKGYIQRNNYCNFCRKPFDGVSHFCEYGCKYCGGVEQCQHNENTDQYIDCDACERTFPNINCYEYHLNTKSQKYCGKLKICEKCGNSYNPKKSHKCFLRKCIRCYQEYRTTPHYCSIKPLNKDKLQEQDKENKFIVCFDIEATRVEQDYGIKHVPNLLIAHVYCDHCHDNDTKTKKCDTFCGENGCDSCEKGIFDACSHCYKDHYQFDGTDCVKKFGNFLYEDLAIRGEADKSKLFVFAHNFKGYDGHFIFQDLFSRKFKDQPQITMQGTKIMRLVINNIRFLDTLCLFPMSLNRLAKSFGLKSVKGFFPHKFNIPLNYAYRGRIPDIGYFDLGNMKPKQADECRKWHSEWPEDKPWVFQEELIKYCDNDVKILKQSIMEYRHQFKVITGLDPISRAFTIAGVALEHFKSEFLPEYTMTCTPLKGYVNNRSKSMKANIWLDFIQRQNNETIHREQPIGQYFADGFIPKTKTVFEFLGCHFHGCPICKNKNRDVPKVFDKTYDQVYEEWNKKLKWYKKYNYNVITIWEHDFDIEKNKNNELKKFYNRKREYYKFIEDNGNINIEDAFFGGRVEPFVLNQDFDSVSEWAKYYDVTSLYPYVMVNRKFAPGIPRYITEWEDDSIDKYFGFIRCTVLAPEDLYIPVLPVKHNDKLYFPLCVKCIESKCKSCPHTDEERQMTGTWFSEELKKAVEKGYQIIKIHQILHYDYVTEDLFKDYIRKWLKMKTEASGWPSHCKDEESKRAFIEEFERREKIKLDYDKIEFNPGLRAIAKLMLNSLWGKFAQKPNQPQTQLITEHVEFDKIINDSKYQIKGITEIDDDTMLVNYKFVDDSYDKTGGRNKAIAAQVTAWARLKLYDIMDKIEESEQGRVMYCDTDSVVFRHREGWSKPQLADYLGDMTDEIAGEYGEGSKIASFCSTGPKSYGYEVQLPDGKRTQQIKCKGINLTSGAVDQLTYEEMRSQGMRFLDTQTTVECQVKQLQFTSDVHHNVMTKEFYKTYRTTFDKRVVVNIDGLQTTPFGYKFN